jgi:hypothetical protein
MRNSFGREATGNFTIFGRDKTDKYSSACQVESRCSLGSAGRKQVIILSDRKFPLQSHPPTRDFGPGKVVERLESLMNGWFWGLRSTQPDLGFDFRPVS